MALNFLKRDTEAKVEEKDTLGGGSYILDTGAYDMIIDSAYLDQSAGGAYSMNLGFKSADGKQYSETIYITSGTAKGCLNTYIDKKTGEKKTLPGYDMVDTIVLCATGQSLGELEPEEKVVEVYNPELKKKAPAKKQVFMDLIGKPVTLGIIKVKEFKNVKQADGTYAAGTDVREFNEINKAFNTESKQTVVEAKAGEEASFYTKWVEKNTADYIKDKTKGAKPAAGASTAGASAKPTKSLFGN